MATTFFLMLLVAQLPNVDVDLDLPELAGGAHWRLQTPRGPVHVWQPKKLDVSRCGVVVYAHGYFNDVDEVWRSHRLAEQFARSRVQARFIVPEVPRNRHQPERWPSLAALLAYVGNRVGEPCRRGARVAIGHSGGYRTIAGWLEESLLSDVVLLDALYGHEAEYSRWLQASEARHRLILASDLTRRRSSQLADRHPGTLRLRKLSSPTSSADLLARLVYFAGDFGHWDLVTDGVAIPTLLSWTELRPPPFPAS